MSTFIDRKGFMAELSGGAVFINPEHVDANTLKALKAAGLEKADLVAVAGADGIIKGEKEYGELFDRLDRAEKDGNKGQLTLEITVGDDDKPTASQGALDALEKEIELNRARAKAKEPPVYCGDPGAPRCGAPGAGTPAQKDQDAAAIAWGRTKLNSGLTPRETTQKRDVEVCASAYAEWDPAAKKNRIVFTAPNISKSRETVMCPAVPAGKNKLFDAHTHPDQTDANTFSKTDLNGPGTRYLYAPDGSTVRYDSNKPATITVVEPKK